MTQHRWAVAFGVPTRACLWILGATAACFTESPVDTTPSPGDPSSSSATPASSSATEPGIPATDSGVDSTASTDDATDSADSSTTGSDTETTAGSTTDPDSTGPHEVSRVILFYGDSVLGDLDGQSAGDIRGFVDGLCEQELDTLAVPCETTHAVITVDAADGIGQLDVEYGMPFDLPVEGPTEVLIAPNFVAMLGKNGALVNSLNAALVPGGPAELWWSGSTEVGSPAENCSDWTDPSATAAAGNPTLVDTSWLLDVVLPCDVARPILCACW